MAAFIAASVLAACSGAATSSIVPERGTASTGRPTLSPMWIQYPAPAPQPSSCDVGAGGCSGGGTGGTGGTTCNYMTNPIIRAPHRASPQRGRIHTMILPVTGCGNGASTPQPSPSPCTSTTTNCVACSGTASQCQNISCNGSQYSIGSITTAPDGNTAQVTDINSIQQESGGSSWNVGWIYQVTETPPNQAPETVRYMQGDLSTSVGVSWSLSIGLISVSVSPSGGTYTPMKHYPGWPLPGSSGMTLSAQKCETQGSVLV